MARVLLGVTGSVAALKTPFLHTDLKRAGHEVKVVATRAATYFFDPGAIERHIAGMDDEIGMLVGDPRRERRPIVDQMWLVPAQMRVGNLDNSHLASLSVESAHI